MPRNSTSPPRAEARTSRTVALAIALLAAFTATFFFAPRFSLWNGFNLPEVDRALDTLRQLRDPFEPIPNHVSRVNQWRLLFPLVGHLLHLNDTMFLALPWIGCLATLVYVARLCQRETLQVSETILATIIAALSPWYFVSTGWLAYFDSWLVLTMLVSCFSRSPIAVIVACLAGPWIDERFVLAIPVLIATRWVWDRSHGEKFAQSGKMLLAIGLTGLGYLAVRLIALAFGTDEVSGTYIAEHDVMIRSVPPHVFLIGLWMGHRASWIFVVCFIVYCFQHFRRSVAGAATAIVILTAVGALVIAGDMHRSLEMLLPVCLGGMLLAKRLVPRRYLVMLGLVAIANLALPASHRLWHENFPIHSALHELAQPPLTDQERIQAGMDRAARLQAEGDRTGAQMVADHVVAVDPDNLEAIIFRARLNASLEDFQQAEQDFAKAVELAPNSPDLMFLYGMLALESGRPAEASERLRQAVQLGGPSWPGRPDTLALLETLARQTGENDSMPPPDQPEPQ